MKHFHEVKSILLIAGILGALCSVAQAQDLGSESEGVGSQVDVGALSLNSEREPTNTMPQSVSEARPLRPKDGDKLGYSKSESARRLDSETRDFLDGVLKIYREPGIFSNPRETFSALGTTAGMHELIS